ncbi:MAG: sensor histidine kinase [Bacteroidetes bacterium]|nr:sensor histidine kinase [Bacteroidota bacterium]
MTPRILKFTIKPIHHVLFWSIYFFLNFIRWGLYFDNYSYSFKSNLVEFVLIIPLVYLNLYVLVPRYILKSKYIKYILSLILGLLVLYLLKTGLTYWLISKNIWPEANQSYRPFDINHIVAVFIGELYVIGMASSVYFATIWLKERDQNRSLKEDQLKMQIKNLESQIQPHFFFNTLNNLYSLSLSKSSLVPSTIIKLSGLMKYVIYDLKNKNLVLLTQELEYIQNYVDIEKLRFKNIEVQTHIDSNINQVLVPPMIFINFIENSFKHGGYQDELKIKINCYLESKNHLTFEVINNFVDSKSNNNGIGIQNAIERLKILFNNQFEFHQFKKLNYFITRLSIPVSYDKSNIFE